MKSHYGHAHMSMGVDGVRGWVGRGPLESRWFCHPLARPGTLLGPQRAGGCLQPQVWVCVASSQSSTRSSYYGPWGRSGAWASRRSSWNSLKHKPPCAEHESLLSAERGGGSGGGARACEGAGDEGPPRAVPLHIQHAHHAHHGPHPMHRHHHHRRTLSLDTRDSVDLAELGPAVGPHPRAAWRTVGMVPGHEDCNGRMPSIAKEVFTEMGDRQDDGDDEGEVDYVSCPAEWPGWGEEEVRWTGGGAPGAGLEWGARRD